MDEVYAYGIAVWFAVGLAVVIYRGLPRSLVVVVFAMLGLFWPLCVALSAVAVVMAIFDWLVVKEENLNDDD